MARVMHSMFKRRGSPRPEVEKAVEDAGSREVRRLAGNLRPLVVVAVIAPLLGLLGTVWGMIQAFQNIARKLGLTGCSSAVSGLAALRDSCQLCQAR